MCFRRRIVAPCCTMFMFIHVQQETYMSFCLNFYELCLIKAEVNFLSAHWGTFGACSLKVVVGTDRRLALANITGSNFGGTLMLEISSLEDTPLTSDRTAALKNQSRRSSSQTCRSSTSRPSTWKTRRDDLKFQLCRCQAFLTPQTEACETSSVFLNVRRIRSKRTVICVFWHRTWSHNHVLVGFWSKDQVLSKAHVLNLNFPVFLEIVAAEHGRQLRSTWCIQHGGVQVPQELLGF